MRSKSFGAWSSSGRSRFLALAAVAVFIIAAGFVTATDESDAAATKITITETMAHGTCSPSEVTVSGSGATSTATFKVKADTGYMFVTKDSGDPDIDLTFTGGGKPDVTFTPKDDKMTEVTVKLTNLTDVTAVSVASDLKKAISVKFVMSAGTDTTDQKYVPQGEPYNYTFKAIKDYNLPPENGVEVKVDGKKITTNYSYNPSTGLVKLLSDVTLPGKAVVVTGTYDPKFVNVTIKTVTSSESSPDVKVDKALIGRDYSHKFSSIPGYDLPASVSVKCDGSDMTGFTYTVADDKSSATLKIPSSKIEKGKDIEVTAKYMVQHYTVTVEVQHATVLSTEPASPAYGSKLTVTLKPADGYAPPKQVTVVNGTEMNKNYTYDSKTGVVVIPSVKGNVVVTGVGVPQTYTIKYMDGTDEIPREVIDGILTAEQQSAGYTFMQYTFSESNAFPLPWDAHKDLYVFVQWIDQDGNPVTEIPANTFGDKVYYAVYRDDLSVYDLDDYTMPLYIIAAVAAVLALLSVAVTIRK